MASREYWFPDIRSLAGASLQLALVLYPYVYFIVPSNVYGAKTFLPLQSVNYSKMHAMGKALDASLYLWPAHSLRVALSLGGVETIGDFGTVITL